MIVLQSLKGRKEATLQRQLSILLYITPDKPDAQHCTRELASQLVKPTEKPIEKHYKQFERFVCCLKRTGGYAVKLPKVTRGTSVLQPNGENDQHSDDHLLEVFTDSDWGGNRATRKSVSVAHSALIHALTTTQKAVALSSCEAGYVAMTTGASEGVFLKNCIEFLMGKRCRMILRCDSSSARAFCHRQGVGRVRHISCGLLCRTWYRKEKWKSDK